MIYSVVSDATGNVYTGGAFTDDNKKEYVAKYAQTLPVTLASITAAQENKDVAINWKTANEINTSHFNVERSTDGSSFTEIGAVKAVGSGGNSYEFMDNKPANGINYYRLQSVDKDGSFAYSKVVSVNVGRKQSFSIVPNPARDFATISFGKTVECASVAVYDMTGESSYYTICKRKYNYLQAKHPNAGKRSLCDKSKDGYWQL